MRRRLRGYHPAMDEGPRGDRIRRRIELSGAVQGVGFRPFVARLAARHGLAGWVRNQRGGVEVEAEGPPGEVHAFTQALEHPPPPGAVQAMQQTPAEVTHARGFEIRPSHPGPAHQRTLPVDLPTCPGCLDELARPGRRRGWALNSCAGCGPRFSMLDALPFDRARTSMRAFPLCPACRAEYQDPADRRFHAQAMSCPGCGPPLWWWSPQPADTASSAPPAVAQALAAARDLAPVAAAVSTLRAGGVVAVQGVGGFHLACDAQDQAAVLRLRAGKRRPSRPLAVMVRDRASAEALVRLDPPLRAALESLARPVVLAPRRPDAPLAPGVAPSLDRVGVLLAYTPLHHLLLEGAGRPLVMTSGNPSGQPLARTEDEGRALAPALADAVLGHQRPILRRVDDSVVGRQGRGVQVLRRARGLAPSPLDLALPEGPTVLAVGGLYAAAPLVLTGRRAHPGPHVGDLTGPAPIAAHREAITGMLALLEAAPTLIAHDLHPDYPTRTLAAELATELRARCVGVQHHHAHLASCLAENGWQGPALGLTFDGTGYGSDGTTWGGELLLGDARSVRRLGRLRPLPLPGADAAVRAPWRLALAALLEAGLPVDEALARVPDLPLTLGAQVARVVASPRVSPRSSSAGRLLDAAAALVGVRATIDYQGQAAIELEALAGEGAGPPPPAPVIEAVGELLEVDTRAWTRAVLGALGDQGPVAAARLAHDGLAEAAVQLVLRARDQLDQPPELVALTGGVFANRRLASRTAAGLEAAGLRVLQHARVPPGDGGLALGQAVVAAQGGGA